MNKLLTLVMVLVLLVPFSNECDAQFWKKKKKNVAVVQDTTKKKKKESYKKIMKDEHQTFKGLFTIHKFKKNSKLLFELPLTISGKDFLLASTITATSDNGDGIVGEKPHDPIHFRFNFENERVQMIFPNNKDIANGDGNIRKAIEKSNLDPIFESFKIEAYNSDSTAVLIDVTKMFAGSQKEIDPFAKYCKNTYFGRVNRTAALNSKDSYVKAVKAFEDNVTIKSRLSFKTSASAMFFSVYSNKPFVADVTRTILQLPEEPMRARFADPRIGIFFNYKKQYNTGAVGSQYRFFTNRWRIEPKDVDAWKRGELVEPVKPIVFYVDPNYPKSWRKYVKAGVEEWQKAFEKIGFKNAIIAKDFPTKEENPDFDPDNLKYSCLRYAPIDIANSMGPSWIDPRSGEIINASVYSYHDVARLLRNWRFVQTAQCDKRVRTKDLDEKIFGDALKYVITHEVGHCLGFMHNMSASAAIPTDSLRSPSFTQKYGTTYSVMDYARFNYVAQPGDLEKGVKLTPPSLGVYDLYAIKWLYSPIVQAKSSEEEIPVLNKWISEKAGNPMYRYGKQQVYYNYDPSSLTEDLGDDAIKSSTYGVKNLKYIMKNFNNWVKDQDEDLSFRNEIYSTVLNQYKRYMGHILSNIGGVYLNESYEGDPYERCEAVTKAKQKAALAFLMNQIKENDWINNKTANKYLKLKLPAHEKINSKIYSAILEKVSNVKLASYKASNAKVKYTSKEYLRDIYNNTWKSLIRGRRLSDAEIVCQNQFVDFILKKSGLVEEQKGGMAALFGGITDGLSYSNDVELLRKRYDSLNEEKFDTKGFEFMRKLKVKEITIPEFVFYEYVLKLKDLVSKNLKVGSLKKRAHCNLLLMKINKATKN